MQHIKNLQQQKCNKPGGTQEVLRFLPAFQARTARRGSPARKKRGLVGRAFCNKKRGEEK